MMSSTEKAYAQVEKEMLAIFFGLERFDTYVYARRITVQTDHKTSAGHKPEVPGRSTETTATYAIAIAKIRF